MSINVKTLTYNHGNNKLTASFYQDYILMRYIDFDTNIVYENMINESIVREYKQLNDFNDVINIVNGAIENDDVVIKIDIPVPTKKCLIVNITHNSKYVPFTICLLLNRLQGENTFSGELKKNIMDLETKVTDMGNEITLLKKQNMYLRKITENIRIPIATFLHNNHANVFSINPNADILWLPYQRDRFTHINPNIFSNNHKIIQQIIPAYNYWCNTSLISHETIGPINIKMLYMEISGCNGDHSHCGFWYEKIFDILQIDTLICMNSSTSQCPRYRFKTGKIHRLIFMSDSIPFDQETIKNIEELCFYDAPNTRKTLDRYKQKFIGYPTLCDKLIQEILESKTNYGL